MDQTPLASELKMDKNGKASALKTDKSSFVLSECNASEYCSFLVHQDEKTG